MNHIPRIAPLRRQVRETTMPQEDKPSVVPAAPASPPQSPVVETSPSDEQRRVWKSDDLLGGDTEALIVHQGQTYRLRRTKQGKLILYK